jgi:hypothetical protein
LTTFTVKNDAIVVGPTVKRGWGAEGERVTIEIGDIQEEGDDFG